MVTMIFWSTLSRGKKMNVLFLVVTAMLPIICKGKHKAHDTVTEKKGNSAVLPSNFTYKPLATGEKLNIILVKNNHSLRFTEILLNCSANTRTCSKNKDNRFQLIGNVFDQNGSVLLKDLQLSDTGPYYFRLEFPDDASKAWTFTEPTNLTVQGSPEILKLDVTYRFFRPTEVVCLAEGNPLPSLTLNFNLAQTGQEYQAENLTIHKANEFQIRGEIQNPTGQQYICNATNQFGTQQKTVYVGIHHPVFIILTVFILIFLLLACLVYWKFKGAKKASSSPAEPSPVKDDMTYYSEILNNEQTATNNSIYYSEIKDNGKKDIIYSTVTM